jgi:DNA sulfur modification protein DndD
MKLDSLKLKDFRQYKGEQSLDFSQDEENNVTVVHGDNGSGKTTILSAFLWVFYDEVSDQMDNPDQHVNKLAMAEIEPGETVEVEVELEFDHEGDHYVATKRAEFRKTDEYDVTGELVEKDLTVIYIDSITGERKKRGDPETSLQQIMPPRLRDLFFFDGERINELSKHGGQDTIQESIQNIMGLTVLERAIRHLESVEDDFEDEVSESASEELQDLVNRKREIEDSLEKKKEEKDLKEKEKSKKEDRISEIERSLQEFEETKELQQERSELEQRRKEKRGEISEINEELKDSISEYGYLVFGMDAVEETAEDLEEKRQKGEIPTDIKQQFVDDRLEMGECICGRSLEEGTEEYDSVREWRDRAGSGELDSVAVTITSRLSRMLEQRDKLFEDLEEKVKDRTEIEDEIRQINERISEIGDDISEKDTEEATSLEEELQKLKEEVKSLGREIFVLEGDIESKEEEISDKEKEIDKVREEKEEADRARRRMKAAREARKVFEELFEEKQEAVREKVNERVNDIFTSIIEKDYYVEIGEDFSLTVLEDVGEEQKPVDVAQSRGERQVASLSFIASLVSLAKENYESDEEAADYEGGIYPIVMDSPFGALGGRYRKRVSSEIPEMADQVLVLVTDTQWSNEVRREMDSIAGEKYSLEYEEDEDDYTEIKREKTLANEA